VHIVSTGNLLTKNIDNGKLLYDFVEKVTSDGCYFHIYPHWQWHNRSIDDFKSELPDYNRLGKKNNRVIFHNCVSPENLNDEISKYHFGIMIRAEFEAEYCDSDSGPYSYNCLRGSGSSRITDYIESDLIIITNWKTKKDLCYFIPNRYSKIVNFNDIINKDNAHKFLQTMLNNNNNNNKNKNLDNYKAEINIKRLIKFYEL